MTIFEKVISIIAPHYCIGCNGDNGPLCALCVENFAINNVSSCGLCDKPTADFYTCQNCRSKNKIDHIWIASGYYDPISELVKRYKFGLQRAAAKPLAGIMRKTLPYLDYETTIVPLPTAPRHIRTRGFDHTLLLARELSKLTGLKYQQQLGRNNNLRQVGNSRAQRMAQSKAAFYVKNKNQSRGQKILLIDDVMTTCASIKAAATVLRKAGVAKIDIVVIAKQDLR